VSESHKLINGVVSGLKVHAGEEEFVRSAGQHAAGVGAAAGLALEGMAGAAAGAGLAASSAGDVVQIFSCTLGDQAVQGRFSKVTFKDGDVLEMVIAPQRNGMPLVLAARRANDRVLWLAPHCSRGKKGHTKFAFLLAWKLLGLFLALGLIFIAVMEYFSASEPFKHLEFDLALITGLSAIAAPYLSIRFYRQWLPIARQAEPIFTALGYPDPSRVDLPRDHKRYCKSKGIGWPYTVNNRVDAGPWTYHYLDDKDTGASR
jgi:hypothetical protein